MTELKKSSTSDEMFNKVYNELRKLASFVLKSDANATLNRTALVHEAWMKLRGSPRIADTSTTHFKGIATRAMRQILVDEARRRNAGKRDVRMVPLTDSVDAAVSWPEELLALDLALDELATFSPRQAQVSESKLFTGMDVDEIAATLGMSPATVERDWRVARAWLAGKLGPERE
ncbi:MAG: ECF-type sigma factor [Bryobacteraceae bacterium]